MFIINGPRYLNSPLHDQVKKLFVIFLRHHQKCLFRVCSLWPIIALFFGVVATTCMHANVQLHVDMIIDEIFSDVLSSYANLCISKYMQIYVFQNFCCFEPFYNVKSQIYCQTENLKFQSTNLKVNLFDAVQERQLLNRLMHVLETWTRIIKRSSLQIINSLTKLWYTNNSRRQRYTTS